MPSNKVLASGACGVALFCTLLCMLLSAAGLWAETRSVVIFVMFFLAVGFLFAHLDKREADAAFRAKLAATGSRAMMGEAIAALNRLEQDETPENRLDFQRKAAQALMSLGEVRVTRRDLAIVATAKAIEAQHALREACEADASQDLSTLQSRADRMARVAVYEIGRMLSGDSDNR